MFLSYSVLYKYSERCASPQGRGMCKSCPYWRSPRNPVFPNFFVEIQCAKNALCCYANSRVIVGSSTRLCTVQTVLKIQNKQISKYLSRIAKVSQIRHSNYFRLNLHDFVWCKELVLKFPVADWIAPWVRNHATISHEIISRRMAMSMNPQSGPRKKGFLQTGYE